MNTIMAAAGYHWTVIPLSERTTSIAALERTSVEETSDRSRLFCQAYQGPPDRFAAASSSRDLPALKDLAQFRVHLLYKRPEIPVNPAVLAIAVSATASDVIPVS